MRSAAFNSDLGTTTWFLALSDYISFERALLRDLDVRTDVDDVFPPALLVLETEDCLDEAVELEGFEARLLDLLPAPLFEDLEYPKRDEYPFCTCDFLEEADDDEDDELTTLAEIKALLIFLIVLRKFSSSVYNY